MYLVVYFYLHYKDAGSAWRDKWTKVPTTCTNETASQKIAEV